MVTLLTSLIWLVHSFGWHVQDSTPAVLSHWLIPLSMFTIFQFHLQLCVCIPDFIVGVCILYFVLLILTSAII